MLHCIYIHTRAANLEHERAAELERRREPAHVHEQAERHGDARAARARRGARGDPRGELVIRAIAIVSGDDDDERKRARG